MSPDVFTMLVSLAERELYRIGLTSEGRKVIEASLVWLQEMRDAS
jgi:hypothetical protein